MENQTTVMPLPFFFIGKDLASGRISNYVEQKHLLLSDALGKADTRSVWYSKEHIAALLDEIEHANGDGLRIFFGAYEPAHEQFSGQTCLVMVATREKQIGEDIIHENVVLEDEPDFEERSSLTRNMPPWPGKNDLWGRKKNFNHGSPCPPLCDGSGGFDFP